MEKIVVMKQLMKKLVIGADDLSFMWGKLFRELIYKLIISKMAVSIVVSTNSNELKLFLNGNLISTTNHSGFNCDNDNYRLWLGNDIMCPRVV